MDSTLNNQTTEIDTDQTAEELSVYRFQSGLSASSHADRISYVVAPTSKPPRNYHEGEVIFQSTSAPRRDQTGRWLVKGEGRWLDRTGYIQTKVQPFKAEVAR